MTWLLATGVLLLGTAPPSGPDLSGMKFVGDQGLAGPRPSEPTKSFAFGLHLGANVLAPVIDVKLWNVYAFVTANVVLAAITTRRIGSATLGIGYTGVLAASPDSAWCFDLFAFTTPGWLGNAWLDNPFVAAGIGIGARYVHRSGLVVGFKLPVFGGAAVWQPDGTVSGPLTGDALVAFYRSALFGLPLLSFGIRF